MSSIKPSVPFIWIPDENIDSCCGCQCTFHLFNRKHHCRFCGKIFCSYCIPHLQQIPSMHDRYVLYKDDLQKCCNKCNSIIINIQNNKGKHIISKDSSKP